jgi:hypothetical protein
MSPLTPELIEPGSIAEMSASQLEDLIISIRERRNRVIKSRGVAHHRARNTSVLSLRPKLEKLATRLDRILAKLDTDLARAEKLVREVTTLRLELGDATPSELASELHDEPERRYSGFNLLEASTPSPQGGGDDDDTDDDEVSASQEQGDREEVSASQEATGRSD